VAADVAHLSVVGRRDRRLRAQEVLKDAQRLLSDALVDDDRRACGNRFVSAPVDNAPKGVDAGRRSSRVRLW
jgi:hypothetical protein